MPRLWTAVAAGLALAACAPEPRPIAYGQDTCAHCAMVVSDARYGAELVTRRGKVHVYDSVECLAAAYLREFDPGQVHSLWVSDFRRPGTLVPAEDAVFLRSPALRSPMGMNLTAFDPAADPEALVRDHGGETLDWDGVLALVRAHRPDGAEPGMHPHAPAKDAG